MESLEGQCGNTSNGDDEGQIHVQIRTIAGDLVEYVMLDIDATIGQFRAKLNKPSQWYKQHKHFVIATTWFSFDDDYMRFTMTKVVKEHIEHDENGKRMLCVVIIVQDTHE